MFGRKHKSKETETAVEGGESMRHLMSWGDFSQHYSERGFRQARRLHKDLEGTGALIHENWMIAQQIAEGELKMGMPTVTNYTQEQADRHQDMLVPYALLSRDDQIKDLYIAYKLDKEWFMNQPGAEDIVKEFPRVITWETVS